MDPFARRAVQGAYDTVAEDYAHAFADDLMRLPVDRAVLEATLERVDRDRDRILDLGCGPGQVGQYLASRGGRVFGANLSPRMLALARRRSSIHRVACGDIRALPFGSDSFGAVVAYYSIQHMPRAHLGGAIDEARRVLQPRGVFVLAAHLGTGEVQTDEFLGHRIAPVAGTLYGREELEDAVVASGFVVEVARERGALPHEHQSQRVYLIARRS